MIFLAYFASAAFVYFVLSPLYFYEMARSRLMWKAILALCVVKGVDWALYMQLNEWAGPLTASVACALLMFGFQEWADFRIKEKPVPFSPKLWTRAAFGLSTVVDGWIHLAVFNGLLVYVICVDSQCDLLDNHQLAGLPRNAWWIACANVAGHVAGLASTYPFVSMRRRNKRCWEGFGVYFVRSTLAAFFISFIASWE